MASRNNSGARNEIIEELKNDHQRAKKNFRDAQKLDAEEDGEELKALVEQTCAELEIHTQLEEELFYPAAREAIKEGDLMDEAEVEHASAKSLIAQLREMSPEDEKYQATFKVLGEYVKHHIKEEESEMFPSIEGRSGVQWAEVQQQMLAMREELMSQMGQEEDTEEEAEAEPARSPSKGRSGRSSSTQRRGAGESRPQAAAEQEEQDE